MTCRPPHTIPNTWKLFRPLTSTTTLAAVSYTKVRRADLLGGGGMLVEGRGGEHSGECSSCAAPWATEVALGYLRPAELWRNNVTARAFAAINDRDEA
jgi:hypothetical protein